MKVSEAVKIVNIEEVTFDIDDAMFGDGSFVVTVANVFDSKQDAERFVEALKLLCKQK